MSFDGIVTNSVVSELREKLIGGRIDKIYQQEKDEILIYIRSKGTNHRLVLSSSSNNPRFYLTEHSKENPATPPMFCMILRKHLVGGIILNVEQFKLDRIIFIDISSRDELGRDSEKRIIIEIMGRHSNIILIDKESQNIIDSVTRVYKDMSRVRQILPGGKYELPPLQEKANPLNSSKDEFLKFIDSTDKNTPVFKFLYFNYLGLSPLISREICFQSGIEKNTEIGNMTTKEKDALYISFQKLMLQVSNLDFDPVLIYKDTGSEILAFYTLNIDQFNSSNKVHFDSISELLDTYYYKKDVLDRISQRSQSIRKSIQIKSDRAKNKLDKQNLELKESKDREKYKIYADLISANIHKIGKGLKEIELENFYDENLNRIIVPLDPKLSPVANAQKYYKMYSRLKNANILLLKQIPETKNEILYLENVLISIENSTKIEELNEIKEELVLEGYIKSNSRKRKKHKEGLLSKPHRYISVDGFNIYVGKNNRQNDYLTLKFAHKEDIWLHVQNMPGSHVIIETQGKNIPSTTLEEAGILAAYYSKGRNSNNVPVDYTERKNVRKPKNAKTGMVIYVNYNTISINPSKKLLNNIKKMED